MSFFELVVRDHSKDHLVAVACVYSDTLTRTRTPLCWTPLDPTAMLVEQAEQNLGRLERAPDWRSASRDRSSHPEL